MLVLLSFCCCSLAKLCLTLCDPMDCKMPSCPVHHQLVEFVQTHVHSVGDAIQPSHPLSFPFPPALSLSWKQGLFQGVRIITSDGQSIGVSTLASVFSVIIQD